MARTGPIACCFAEETIVATRYNQRGFDGDSLILKPFPIIAGCGDAGSAGIALE